MCVCLVGLKFGATILEKLFNINTTVFHLLTNILFLVVKKYSGIQLNIQL